MRNNLCYLLLFIVSSFTTNAVYAQSNEVAESGMRSNGKIYVVMAICITILAGLFLYLVSIDRKISRIEDKQ
ncbi:MAG: CcmD family protein [Ferruginibacter sp.]